MSNQLSDTGGYVTFIEHLDPAGAEADGKWDYRVIVVQSGSQVVKSERVSGGMEICDAMRARLIRELEAA